MADMQHSDLDSHAPVSPLMPLYLAIAWLWVGIPLAWGVYQTIKKSLPLFQ